MFSRHGSQWPLDEDEQMSITAREHLLDWLRDAHAMEKQAEQMLSAQIARLEHYPDLRRRLQQHLSETRTQCALVDNCIARLGGDTSLIKDAMGKVAAMGQGLSGLFVSDEVLKGALASYAFEHMEIASYTMLIAAADAIGDRETARICSQILKEEQEMAEWLCIQMPNLMRAFLKLEETPGVAAKR
jgi:ferritin-like metal-binding protein YciE